MGTVRYLPRATNLVFVGLETGTIDVCDSSARVVDISATGFVADGDDYVDDIEILNLAETSGVPVADLWAAWERQRRVESVIGGVYDIDDDGEIVLFTVGGERAGDEEYDNAHRCDDCGVTGGGVVGGVCQDCDGERQRRSGDGCAQCGTRYETDSDGVVCPACHYEPNGGES